jgi:hypothetical protein
MSKCFLVLLFSFSLEAFLLLSLFGGLFGQCGDFEAYFLMRFRLEIWWDAQDFRVFHFWFRGSATSLVCGNVGALMILWR